MTFFVPGTPAPKGSMRAFQHRSTGRVVTTNDNAKTKPWMERIAWQAKADGVRPSDAPIAISLSFCLPRPKGHLGARGLLASAPRKPTKKPDLDKLIRCVLDALTGIAWADDAQVVSVTAWKRYGLFGHGVSVEVMEAP